MADDPAPAPAPAAAAGRNLSAVKLPPFWTSSPANWFRYAEAQFVIKEVVNPIDRFYLTVSALSEESMRRVQSVIAAAATEESYENLKTALIRQHSLSAHQQIDKLISIDSLGGKTPSGLLADMLELCPPGEENTDLFLHLFLLKLPREVRILLADQEKGNMREVAEKADKLMAHHRPQSHDAVNAVAADTEDSVNAAAAAKKQAAGRGNSKQKPRFQKSGQRRRSPSPALQNGLCFYHNRYGDKAHQCRAPCCWPEN